MKEDLIAFIQDVYEEHYNVQLAKPRRKTFHCKEVQL